MGSRKATTADIIAAGYYQPSIFARFGMALLLAFSAFALPYSTLTIATAASEEARGIDAVPEVTPTEEPTVEEEVVGEGELPRTLLFSNDEDIPESANIVIAQPVETEWVQVSWTPSEAEYEFRNCTITATIQDENLSSTGRDASEEAVGIAFPNVNVDNGDLVQVTEVRYNVISTAQYFGFGYQTLSGDYSWVYVRGFSTLDKVSFIGVECPTQDEMYEAADSVRSQLGILISP